MVGKLVESKLHTLIRTWITRRIGFFLILSIVISLQSEDFTASRFTSDNCCGGRRGRGELLARRRRLDLDSDEWAESSAARRRHSRVSRRWTACQAEMITNIEGRNWESELIALVGLHTVSMLDASFLSDNDYAISSHDNQLGPQTTRDHENSSREQSPDLGAVQRERERHLVHG